jgi:hypothetical protein
MLRIMQKLSSIADSMTSLIHQFHKKKALDIRCSFIKQELMYLVR